MLSLKNIETIVYNNYYNYNYNIYDGLYIILCIM